MITGVLLIRHLISVVLAVTSQVVPLPLMGVNIQTMPHSVWIVILHGMEKERIADPALIGQIQEDATGHLPMVMLTVTGTLQTRGIARHHGPLKGVMSFPA